MRLVDTHCHLQFDKLGNPANIIADAAAAGVTKLICVGTTLEDSRQAIKIAAAYDNVWASAGVHPHEAKESNLTSGELEKVLAAPKVVAVGETGLDYYKNYSPREDQRELLKTHIQAGLKLNMPFIFHVRDAQHQNKFDAGQAWDDFFETLDWFCDIRGVVHSFSATP